MGEKIKVKELHKTCGACPAQWEGMTVDDKPIYIRYRWGYFSFSIGESKETNLSDYKEVFGEQRGDSMDGSMDNMTMYALCSYFCDFSYIEKLVKE